MLDRRSSSHGWKNLSSHGSLVVCILRANPSIVYLLDCYYPVLSKLLEYTLGALLLSQMRIFLASVSSHPL